MISTKARFAVRIAFAAALVLSSILATSLTGGPAAPAASIPPVAAAPRFDDAFWKHWGDGKAELAGYDLRFPRYGELRRGEAVTIFVTETFSHALRVKSDPGKHPKSDEYPVMKLNLVQDFSTGIYDYNLMTSAFVALTSVDGRPAGSATKVSFSSQEWCGNVFGELVFDPASARYVSHSYFDGEADRDAVIPVPADALAADAILLWARGFAAPALAPGERREVTLLESLRDARLEHRPLRTGRASLSRASAASRVTVPAGTFDVERRTVELAGGEKWSIDVEANEPHRIIQWATSKGEKASLLASDRLEYWKMHAEANLPALAKIGFEPRPPRTP